MKRRAAFGPLFFCAGPPGLSGRGRGWYPLRMDRRFLALFIAAALVLAAGLAWTAVRWDGAIRAYESRFRPADGSGEGAAPGRGRIFLDNDAYYWVAHAQEMAETGRWRIRHTSFDNPPGGRPVHWSQSISWLLLLAGGLRHAATGEAWPAAIENAAHGVEPALYFLLVAGTGWLVFRRLGLAPALIWMLHLAMLPAVSWSFHPMRPDHHGLQLGFMLSSALCLVLGGLGRVRSGPEDGEGAAWFRPLRPPGRRTARRLAIASGVLGGFGLWTGASVLLPGMMLLVAGAGVVAWFARLSPPSEEEGEEAWEPSFWRMWSRAGAATAILFYLIEYAPAFPGMRLEVNHPLYAVSWVCAGELLTRLAAGRGRGFRAGDGWLVPLAAGVLLLPALMALGPSEWHGFRDPLMRRLHESIDEFHPYLAISASAPWKSLWKDFGMLPVFLVLAPFLAGGKRILFHEWAALWMGYLLALGYGALTLWQARWANFFAASVLLLAILALAILWRNAAGRGRAAAWFCVLAAALAVQPAGFLNQQRQDIHCRDTSREQIGELTAPILQRQLAERLGAMDAAHSFRVMGSPNLAARLAYYGGVPVLCSYYWENLDGLRASAAFFAAEDDGEALRIARERGITHVILPPTVEVARLFHYVWNGVRSEEGVRRSIGGRLLAEPGALPPWIRRDAALEKALQPGYLVEGRPVFGTLQVFTVRAEP